MHQSSEQLWNKPKTFSCDLKFCVSSITFRDLWVGTKPWSPIFCTSPTEPGVIVGSGVLDLGSSVLGPRPRSPLSSLRSARSAAASDPVTRLLSLNLCLSLFLSLSLSHTHTESRDRSRTGPKSPCPLAVSPPCFVPYVFKLFYPQGVRGS